MILLILLILSACSHLDSPIISSKYLEPNEFSHYLDKSAVSVAEDGIPQGTVSVVYYGTFNDKSQILFVRNKVTGLYSGFVTDLIITKDKKPETYAQAAIRVVEEGTAKLYNLTRADLNKAKIYYETKEDGSADIIIFIKTTQMFSNKRMLDAQKKCKGDLCGAFDDFCWVPTQMLLSLGADNLNLDNAKKITFDPVFMNSIKQNPFNIILQDINRGY